MFFYFLNEPYSSLLSLCCLLHIVHFFSINLHFHLSTLQASLYFFSSVHNLCLIKVSEKEFIANTSIYHHNSICAATVTVCSPISFPKSYSPQPVLVSAILSIATVWLSYFLHVFFQLVL